MCRHYLDQIDHLDQLITRLDERIAALSAKHDNDMTVAESARWTTRRCRWSPICCVTAMQSTRGSPR